MQIRRGFPCESSAYRADRSCGVRREIPLRRGRTGEGIATVSVRNNRTSATVAAAVTWAIWLWLPALSTHRGLGGTAVDDKGAAEGSSSVGCGEANDILIGVQPLVVARRIDARGRGALGKDHDGAGAGDGEPVERTSLQCTSGNPRCGRPPTTGPMIAMPCPAKSQAALAAVAPTTTNSEPGNFGSESAKRKTVARTAMVTNSVGR